MRMHIRMFGCMYVHMNERMYVSMYLCIYVSMYVCTYVCMYVCMNECMHILYLYIYIQKLNPPPESQRPTGHILHVHETSSLTPQVPTV